MKNRIIQTSLVLIFVSGCMLTATCYLNTDTEAEIKNNNVEILKIKYEASPLKELIAKDKAIKTEITKETSEDTTEEVPIEETKEVDKPVETIQQPVKTSLGTYKLTAYCACTICTPGTGITASGTTATQGRTIAVDTSIIPFGTKVIINGNTYIAEDTGGAIKGNKIDIFFNSHQEALNFGVQYAEIFTYK